MTERRLSPLDRLLARADNALRTLTPGTVQAERSPTSSPTGPGSDIQPGTLPGDQRRHVLGLMRINHTGEVCAQALYQGQASTASLPHIRHAMEESAREEEDHLAWCEEVGATAGLIGDRWSLGFVTETENQVVKHLESHLYQVPESDLRTRAILEQMKTDELKHAVTAKDAGGADLPLPVRHAMTLMSKVMTFTTYRI